MTFRQYGFKPWGRYLNILDEKFTKVKEIILKKKYASQKKLDEIDLRVKDLVKECEKFAEESSYPDKNVMYDSVYEQKDYPFLKHKI